MTICSGIVTFVNDAPTGALPGKLSLKSDGFCTKNDEFSSVLCYE